MPKKYQSANNDFCKYTDLEPAELWKLLKTESSELERTDLKAIAMELCTRLMNAK